MTESNPAWPLRDAASHAESSDPSSVELFSLPGGRSAGPRLGRVLIVEDNRDAREMYALYFRVHGYDVATAEDGRAGVELAERLKPDVIVMDLSMPRMSGVAAAEYLKRVARMRDVRIILLTGHHIMAIEERGLERGVDVFLTKPCLPEDLEGHVRRLLDARSR